MATANDLISNSLRKAGILSSGETAEGEDADETLEIMNDILEQWSLEDLMVYYSTILTVPLIAGTNSYSIGPTGDLVATRPIELLAAWIRTADNLDIPIDYIAFENYQYVIQKATAGTYPNIIAYQPTYPNGVVYLWQSPAAGLSLRINVASQFIAVADLDTEITFPPGYKKAIQDAITVELCIKYGRSEMLDSVKEAALYSKMLIKRKNSKRVTMRLRKEFLPGNNGVYNPYSDT